MIDRTGGSLYLKNATGSTQSKQTKTLGENDFLKLLIAQLKNQSPDQPMNDQKFISQMATFSTLEQITNMNTEIKQFLQKQTSNDWVADTQLIGKHVKWKTNDQAGGGTADGVVQSVNFKNGQVHFVMGNGQTISQGQILEVGLS